MAEKNLFTRIIIALSIWLGTWFLIGSFIGLGITSLFYDNAMDSYLDVVQETNEMMPINILEASIDSETILNASGELSSREGAIKKQKVLKMFQGISSAIGFILSSFIIVLVYQEKITAYLKIDKPLSGIHLIIIPLLFITALPVIAWSGVINQLFSLPEFMSSIEIWMKEMEFQNGVLSMFLVQNNDSLGLIGSVIIMAVIPAIGEELLFRGIIQRNLIETNMKPLFAILITATLFSAMHLQFFGFLPRFILGFILGYIYHYSNTIWAPIIGHFTQNAVTVVLLHYMLKHPQEEWATSIQSNPSPSTTLVFSIIFLLLFYTLYRYSKNFTTDNLEN